MAQSRSIYSTPCSAVCLVLAGSMLAAAIGGCAVEEGSSSPEAPAPVPSAERFAPGVVSTDGFELGTALAPDGETVYFASIGDGFQTSVIQSSTWSESGWSTPSPVAFAGRYRDLDPSVSADGTQMFFQSDRPLDGVEPKDWDIWVSDWTPDGWGEPRNLGAPVNTAFVETYPVVTASGALYFSSDRAGGHGEGDVYRAQPINGGYLEPENLGPPINGPEFDSNASVSADERCLVLSSSSLSPHQGGGDLYFSYREEAGWSEPQPVPGVNTPMREFAPSLSPDGKYLFFTRDQRDPEAGPVLFGDIFQVESTMLGPRCGAAAAGD